LEVIVWFTDIVSAIGVGDMGVSRVLVVWGRGGENNERDGELKRVRLRGR